MTSILNTNNHSFSSTKARRNRPSPLSSIPSPASSLSLQPRATASPSPAESSSKSINSYFSESQDPILLDTSNIPISSVGLLMPSAYDFPQPHGVDFSYLADAPDLVQPWTNSGVQSRSVANSLTTVPRNNGHHRDQSSSSIGSASTHPLYNNRAHTVASRKSQTQRNSHTSDQLPTPTQTPTKPSFLSSGSSNLSQPSPNLDHSIASSMALSQALYQSHDNLSQLHSARPAYSSNGQEPMTSRTGYNDYQGNHNAQAGETQNPDGDAWLAEYLRSGNDLDTMTHPMVPKFERTVTDAYQDELYLPQQQQMQPSQQLGTTSYLMPQNQMVQDRLNEARMARTASSSTNQSGPLSPFKATSPFMHSPAPYSHQVHPMRREGRVSPHSESEPKTISPQEALLDYKPQRDEVPLFGQSGANYASYVAVAPTTSKSSSYQTVPSMTFGGMPAANHGAWSNDLQQATLSSAPLQNFNFEAPALPTNLTGLPNHYLTAAPLSSRTASRQTDRTPEFPAHLPTMESSASEAPASSGTSSHQILDSPKPPSNADTGTYSCTYHGCSQRFATPRELQRHKRDVHRSNPNVTPGVGSGMSSAQLLERNSQSGPHRCERINPTTGKPCNTNFSRPYDLTRHEDTIHNVRKLKLKCALCTEEKLFSRNDALTRHLRVVHPEVEFPGKHRRRGTRGD